MENLSPLRSREYSFSECPFQKPFDPVIKAMLAIINERTPRVATEEGYRVVLGETFVSLYRGNHANHRAIMSSLKIIYHETNAVF